MSTEKSTKTLGIILGVIGVVFFSAKAVMVKLAYAYDIDPVSLLLFRMLFALPFYIVVALIKRPQNPEKIVKKDYLWIVFCGFVGYYLASYFDFLGLQYIKASLERIVLFMYPTLVLLISLIFFKIKITRVQGVAIGLTYVGIVVIFWEELEVGEFDTILGGSLVFVSALTYAIYLTGSGQLIPKFGAITFTSYAMIVSCISIVIHYGIFGSGSLTGYPLEVYILALCMAFLSTVIPSYLVSGSIKLLGAGNFSMIGSLGPISTIVLANIFLDERLTWVQVLGALIVISGIWVVNRK